MTKMSKSLQEIRDYIVVTVAAAKKHIATHKIRLSDGFRGVKYVGGVATALTPETHRSMHLDISMEELRKIELTIPVFDHLIANEADATDINFYSSLTELFSVEHEEVSKRYKEYVDRCYAFFGTDDYHTIMRVENYVLSLGSVDNAVEKIVRQYTVPIVPEVKPESEDVSSKITPVSDPVKHLVVRGLRMLFDIIFNHLEPSLDEPTKKLLRGLFESIVMPHFENVFIPKMLKDLCH